MSMLGEITHLQTLTDDLKTLTMDPHKLPPSSEQVPPSEQTPDTVLLPVLTIPVLILMSYGVKSDLRYDADEFGACSTDQAASFDIIIITSLPQIFIHYSNIHTH